MNKPIASKSNLTQTPLDRLLWVMECLRDPENGCPWDIEQDFKSIAPYTIEEAYEVVDAIERNDLKDLKEELGDLLLQVIYHAQMAKESNHFDFDQIAEAVADKMIARHPHVFSDRNAENSHEVDIIWEQQKEKEKPTKSAIDCVTRGLPALLRAAKLQKKAAKAGFEWKDLNGAIDKIQEELTEFIEAMQSNDIEHQEEELGDFLFCIVNYARMHGLESETALRNVNVKFENRFQKMEEVLKKEELTLADVSLEKMLDAWVTAKTK